jgi:hypothetical protein
MHVEEPSVAIASEAVWTRWLEEASLDLSEWGGPVGGCLPLRAYAVRHTVK